MNNDIETIINDNIALKKIMQSNKIQIQKIERQRELLK